MFHVEHFEENVSRETFEKLRQYEALLLKWQKRISLVSSSSMDEVWDRHIIDSLQMVKCLPDRGVRILDIGSGAGFPGLVLVIAGYTNVFLVESNTRKINFLKHVALELNLDVTILHQRVEKLKESHFDVIVSRAVSSLVGLLEMALSKLSDNGLCFFLKGKNFKREVDDAKKKFDFRYETYKSITHDEGVILKVFDLQKK